MRFSSPFGPLSAVPTGARHRDRLEQTRNTYVGNECMGVSMDLAFPRLLESWLLAGSSSLGLA